MTVITAKPITIPLKHITLAGLSWGNENGEPILALHGWLDNAASFMQLAPLLKDYHVIALDMPGHGHSSHLPEGLRYHFLDAVDVVIHVLNYLNWQQAVLMGHSLGGAVASMVASSFPERVKKLILLDSIGPLSEESVKAPGRLRDAVAFFVQAEKMQRKTYKKLETMLNLRQKVNHVSAVLMQPLVERAVKAVAGGFQWRFDPALSLPSLSYFSEEQVLAFLAAISMPVLLVEAEQGILTESDLLTTRKQRIANLQICNLPGPHHIHITQAAATAAAIQRFIVSQ